MKGPVAQRLEQGTHNPLVVGSNPTGPTSLTLCKPMKQRVLDKSSKPAKRLEVALLAHEYAAGTTC